MPPWIRRFDVMVENLFHFIRGQSCSRSGAIRLWGYAAAAQGLASCPLNRFPDEPAFCTIAPEPSVFNAPRPFANRLRCKHRNEFNRVGLQPEVTRLPGVRSHN